MSGDWIKMRSNLDTDPDVINISHLTKSDVYTTIGRLWKLWSWADQHSMDGSSVRVTSATLDSFTLCPGFAAAMRNVGWLEGRDSALTFPRFDHHNGQTAKNRAEDARRKARQRLKDSNENKELESVRNLSGICPEFSGLEKRREDKREEQITSNTKLSTTSKSNTKLSTTSKSNTKLSTTSACADVRTAGQRPKNSNENKELQSVRKIPDICPENSGPEKRREEKRREDKREEQITSGTSVPPPPAYAAGPPAGEGLEVNRLTADPHLEPPGPRQCPHQQIVRLYHECLPELRRVRDWTPARQKLLAARWRENPERQGLAWWRDYFQYVRESDFLKGKTNRPFDCDLEWLVRPANLVKVIEGRYENRRAAA